jgi:hypothetical protein
MIAKKLKELQLKAQRRDHNKGDPAWKQKEKERLEMMEKEKHLQGILQHPLAVHRPSLVAVAAKHKVAEDSFFSPLSLPPSLLLSRSTVFKMLPVPEEGHRRGGGEGPGGEIAEPAYDSRTHAREG